MIKNYLAKIGADIFFKTNRLRLNQFGLGSRNKWIDFGTMHWESIDLILVLDASLRIAIEFDHLEFLFSWCIALRYTKYFIVKRQNYPKTIIHFPYVSFFFFFFFFLSAKLKIGNKNSNLKFYKYSTKS